MEKQHKNIKAIKILEFIASELGNEDIFDGEIWYVLEDGIMEIINSENKKDELKQQLKDDRERDAFNAGMN